MARHWRHLLVNGDDARHFEVGSVLGTSMLEQQPPGDGLELVVTGVDRERGIVTFESRQRRPRRPWLLPALALVAPTVVAFALRWLAGLP